MLVNICGVCPTRPGYLSYFIDIASYFQIVFLSLAASVSPEEFCFSTFVKMSLVCITESVWQSVDGWPCSGPSRTFWSCCPRRWKEPSRGGWRSRGRTRTSSLSLASSPTMARSNYDFRDRSTSSTLSLWFPLHLLFVGKSSCRILLIQNPWLCLIFKMKMKCHGTSICKYCKLKLLKYYWVNLYIILFSSF